MLISELFEIIPRPGKIVFICIRRKRLEPVTSLTTVNALAERGLEGDRYNNKGGSRQVTLIQAEHLDSIGSFLGKEISPELVRRNIVVSGINLLALKGKKFQVGTAIMEYSGECHPCSRMETNLGEGGYNAMRGHGGITAKVINGGKISVADELKIFP
jgi:MOSC domain-containing protein YiiM